MGWAGVCPPGGQPPTPPCQGQLVTFLPPSLPQPCLWVLAQTGPNLPSCPMSAFPLSGSTKSSPGVEPSGVSAQE